MYGVLDVFKLTLIQTYVATLSHLSDSITPRAVTLQ